MKRIIACATCMIVILGGIFLTGCSEKEEIQQQTEKNTERYEEMETTTSVGVFYQMYKELIADIDIAELKEVAYDYYKDLTFIEEIIDIRLCENESDIEAYIGRQFVLCEAVVLEVDTITYGMEKLDRRFMTLEKNDIGEWMVYTEGR